MATSGGLDSHRMHYISSNDFGRVVNQEELRTMDDVESMTATWRAFMDNITQQKPLLKPFQKPEATITSARMMVKANKPRSLELKRGKVFGEKFKIGEEIIHTVSENPVQCLGKSFNDSLEHERNLQTTG